MVASAGKSFENQLLKPLNFGLPNFDCEGQPGDQVGDVSTRFNDALALQASPMKIPYFPTRQTLSEIVQYVSVYFVQVSPGILEGQPFGEVGRSPRIR